ncbi:hypothetical protein QBC34DRAFT_497153 [Podospora aff. communis PSN243]|uniref:Uncharacterized protein n=1 Tax=Podospora aff. communis PSN243 TaxID=3040156 RepID=A0AAV9GD44_9PEZI|nr:hypothetical protein QBC34DRAFT_497153 [Podospora aff. communis PSN243]
MANKGADWGYRAGPQTSPRKRPRKKYSHDKDNHSPPPWSNETPHRQVRLSSLATTPWSHDEEKADAGAQSIGTHPITPATTPTTMGYPNIVAGGGIKIRGMGANAVTTNTPQSADSRANLKHPYDHHDDDSSDANSQPSIPNPTEVPFISGLDANHWLRDHCHSISYAEPYATELRGRVCDIAKYNVKLDNDNYDLDRDVYKLGWENDDLKDEAEKREKKVGELNDKLVSLTKTKAGLAGELDEEKRRRAREVDELRNKHQQEVEEMKTAHEKEVDALVKKNNERVARHAIEMEAKEKERRDMEVACSELHTKCQGLEAKLEAMDAERSGLEKTYSELQTTCEGLAMKYKELRAEEGEMRELERAYAGLQTACETLAAKNVQLEGTNKRMEEAEQEMEQRTKELLNSHQEAVLKMADERMEFEKTIRDLQGQLTAATEDRMTLEKTVCDLQGRLTAATEGRMAFEKTVRDLRDELTAATERAKQDAEASTAKLRGDILKYLDKINALGQEADSLKRSNQNLQQQLDRERSDADRSARQNGRLEDEVKTLRGELDGCLGKIKADLLDKVALQAQFDKADKRQKELSARIESIRKDLETKAADLTKEKKEKNTLQKANQALKDEVQVHLNHVTHKEQEIQVLQDDKKSLQDQLSKLITGQDEERSRMSRKIDEAFEAKRELEQDLEASRAKVLQLEGLRLRNAALEEQLASLQGEVNQKVEDNANLLRDVESLRQKNEALEMQLFRHRSEVEERTEENANLLRDLKTLQQQYDALQAEAQKRLADCTHLEKEKADLLRTVEVLGQDKQGLEGSIEAYAAAVMTMEQDKAELVRNHAEALRKTEQKFQEQINRLTQDAQSLQQANATLSDKVNSAVAGMVQREQDKAILAHDVQRLEEANRGLKQRIERSSAEVAEQERSRQELQGMHDALLARERELQVAVQIKDDEIEALKSQPTYHGRASGSLPCPDSPNLLGSGLPTPTPGPSLKPEGPDSELQAGPAPGLVDDDTLPSTEKAVEQPDQAVEGAVEALERELERCLQCYNRLTYGQTRMYFEQLGLRDVMEPHHDTAGLGNDVLVSYLANVADLESPLRVENPPLSPYWKMQDPWVVTPAVEVAPQPFLFEQFVQLCFLISAMRDHRESRLLSSVANIVSSLMHTDHTRFSLPAAAFLRTMATLPPPTFGGIFSSRNVVLAILVCQLCRRLEDVFPDMPKQTWTIGNILGPTVQTEAEKYPIGTFATAITNCERDVNVNAMVRRLEKECKGKFCIAPARRGENNSTKDMGLLSCDEGECFLMIDFTLRCFRLVECQVAMREPNAQVPRRDDLIVEQQGREVFRLPRVPRNVRLFWISAMDEDSAMTDED